jgi:hypothetical protein
MDPRNAPCHNSPCHNFPCNNASAPPARNPFATRFFQPGAIAFHFGSSTNTQSLVDQLIASEPSLPPKHLSHAQTSSQSQRLTTRKCFAIVGPHGTGKSTLLSEIQSEILKRHANLSSKSLFLNSALSPSRCLKQTLQLLANHSVSLVDGYEQLPKWGLPLTRRLATLLRRTFLVTSHSLPYRFCELWKTQMNPQIEHYVVSQLLTQIEPGKDDSTCLILEEMMQSQEWIRSRNKHGENLRESLFDMYDWWRDRVDENLKNR